MDYKKFLKYTRKKHIYMYDAQARIIYNKLINQDQIIQTGGGKNKSVKHIIKHMKPNTLNLFLETVYSNDTMIMKYIINNLI
jgi:hypothetical protein